VFGEPSTVGDLGVSGSRATTCRSGLTLVDGVRPIEAPAFLGASPSHVGSGVLADTRVLGSEEDLGFRLLASLDDAQRKGRGVPGDRNPTTS